MFTVAYGHESTAGLPIVTLKGAGHEVRFLPEAGFNAYYWTFMDKEILMEPVDIRIYGSKYGIPLLFPTPNRVRDSRYTWRSNEYHMVKRGEEISRHGLVMTEKWDVSAEAFADHATCTGTIKIEEGNDLYPGYPFPCTLKVMYTLTLKGLRIDVQVINDGSEDMPFGFAIHPYFSKRGDASKVSITAPVHRVYETDAELLPTGKMIDVAGTDLDVTDYKTVESLYLDNVYRGMTEDLAAKIRYEADEHGDGAATVSLRGSDAFRNIVIYTPHDRPGFCLEHQTNATDFINLYATGLIDESGILVLPPAKVWNGFVEIECEVGF